MATQDLNGKVIVITGARAGLAKGPRCNSPKAARRVVLAARRGDVLNELAAECKAKGGQALAVRPMSASRTKSHDLAQTAIAAFGRIDVWINNAGAARSVISRKSRSTEHVQVIETDLFGTLYGSYFAMRQFKQQGAGNSH